ncbi:MAG: hypothetical protein ACYCVN_12435 [Acidimicrobiales bacterium]
MPAARFSHNLDSSISMTWTEDGKTCMIMASAKGIASALYIEREDADGLAMAILGVTPDDMTAVAYDRMQRAKQALDRPGAA